MRKFFTYQYLWDHQVACWILRLLYCSWKGKHSKIFGHSNNVLGLFTDRINWKQKNECFWVMQSKFRFFKWYIIIKPFLEMSPMIIHCFIFVFHFYELVTLTQLYWQMVSDLHTIIFWNTAKYNSKGFGVFINTTVMY